MLEEPLKNNNWYLYGSSQEKSHFWKASCVLIFNFNIKTNGLWWRNLWASESSSAQVYSIIARTAQHKLQKQDWAPVVILDSIMVFSTLWYLWTRASGALCSVCVPAKEFNPNTFKAPTRASNHFNYKNTKSRWTDLIMIEYIHFHLENKPFHRLNFHTYNVTFELNWYL